MRKRFEFRVELPDLEDKESVESVIQAIIESEGYTGKGNARAQALLFMVALYRSGQLRKGSEKESHPEPVTKY